MTTQAPEAPAAEEVEAKEIPNIKLYIVAVITGIIGYYILLANPNLAFISVILAWPAIVAGAGGVEHLCRYGLGTGTSSIGYWGTAVGATVVFATIFMSSQIFDLYSPFIVIIVGTIIGYVVGLCAERIIKMKIPEQAQQSFIITGSSAIFILIVLEVLSSGGVAATELYYTFPVIYIGTALVILHPYNGSLGAGENQKRTLLLACCEASLITTLFGIIGVLLPNTTSFIPALGMLVISLIGFAVFVRIWWKKVKEDTYEIVWTGYPAGVPH